MEKYRRKVPKTKHAAICSIIPAAYDILKGMAQGCEEIRHFHKESKNAETNKQIKKYNELVPKFNNVREDVQKRVT